MGKNDSSKTRVDSIFESLLQQDSSGRSWLPNLLNLPRHGNSLTLLSSCDYSIVDYGWGKHEKKIEPPIILLSWLIQNLQKPTSGSLSSSVETAKKRYRNPERIGEALACLKETGYKHNGWYIFEGKTQPDVYIETPDLIIVVEGKRTEPSPTTYTKWMQTRSQMLRHVDCAWENKGQKTVVGFYKVEGDESGSAPDKWIGYSEKIFSEGMKEKSLPHRRLEERNDIASCFIGMTTWQKNYNEFGIGWREISTGGLR